MRISDWSSDVCSSDLGISAVPVLDGDALVGIVSEGDLIRRVEIGTAERRRSWWLRLITDNAILATEYVRSHATRVRDIMTRKVVTVTEEKLLADGADAPGRTRVKRIPVRSEERWFGKEGVSSCSTRWAP